MAVPSNDQSAEFTTTFRPSRRQMACKGDGQVGRLIVVTADVRVFTSVSFRVFSFSLDVLLSVFSGVASVLLLVLK